jgi:hypothetical protein
LIFNLSFTAAQRFDSCLSNLDILRSSVTDVNEPKAITWFESALPASTAAYDPDAEELLKLTEEARLLEEEMNKEVALNTELQKQILKSRERNDQMVAMMQLLRTETEAVLERCIDAVLRILASPDPVPNLTSFLLSSRHNTIMESPEARAKAAELHKRAQEAEKLKNPSAEGEEVGEDNDEEDEIDENEVDSEEEESGEEIQVSHSFLCFHQHYQCTDFFCTILVLILNLGG